MLPVVTFLVIIVALFYALISLPAILDSNDRYNKFVNTLGIYQDNEKKLKTVSLTDLTAKFDQLNSTIPSSRADIVNLLADIINIGNKYGLTVQQDISKTAGSSSSNTSSGGSSTTTSLPQQSVTLGQATSGDFENVSDSILINGVVYPISVSLILSGQKNAMLSFFSDINNNKRLLDVINIDVGLDNAETQSWTAKILVYSYAAKPVSSILPIIKKESNPLNTNFDTPPKSVDTKY